MFYRILGILVIMVAIVLGYFFMRTASNGIGLLVDFLHDKSLGHQVFFMAMYLMGIFAGLFCMSMTIWQGIRLMQK